MEGWLKCTLQKLAHYPIFANIIKIFQLIAYLIMYSFYFTLF